MKLETCVFCGKQVITSGDDLMSFTDIHEECLQEASKKLDAFHKKNRRNSQKKRSCWCTFLLLFKKLLRGW